MLIHIDFTGVLASSALPALRLPGDSGTTERLMRATITDFVAAILGALVHISARLSAVTVDRISFRPEPGWSITRNVRTPSALVRGVQPPVNVHAFRDRFSPAESPGR